MARLQEGMRFTFESFKVDRWAAPKGKNIVDKDYLNGWLLKHNAVIITALKMTSKETGDLFFDESNDLGSPSLYIWA